MHVGLFCSFVLFSARRGPGLASELSSAPLSATHYIRLARSTAKPLSHTWKVAYRNGVVRDRMALFYNDFEEFVFPNGLFDCKGCLRGTDACENKIGWAWCYLCPSSIQGLTCHQFCGAT